MVDLSQLKTFVIVVQEGNLTRAAERLHLSQPAASHHIRALEAHFGLPLFHRSPRGLEATAAGKRIAGWASQVLQASHELDQRARELAGAPAGRLAIGTVANQRLWAALPRAVQVLRERFPLTEISIEAANTRAIREALKTGELDAGTVTGAVHGDELAGHALGTLDYVLVAPAAWQDRVLHAAPQAVAAMPWVVTGPGTPGDELIDRFFRDQGLEPNVVAQVSNAALLRSMIAGELGLGFLQQEDAIAGQRAGTMCALPRYAASLPLVFVHARSRTGDAVLGCFVQALAMAWAQDAAPAAPPTSRTRARRGITQRE